MCLSFVCRYIRISWRRVCTSVITKRFPTRHDSRSGTISNSTCTTSASKCSVACTLRWTASANGLWRLCSHVLKWKVRWDKVTWDRTQRSWVIICRESCNRRYLQTTWTRWTHEDKRLVEARKSSKTRIRLEQLNGSFYFRRRISDWNGRVSLICFVCLQLSQHSVQHERQVAFNGTLLANAQRIDQWKRVCKRNDADRLFASATSASRQTCWQYGSYLPWCHSSKSSGLQSC